MKSRSILAGCLLPLLLAGLAVVGLTLPCPLRAAGVTIITHGFSGNAQGWVLGMARRVPAYPGFFGTNVICYEMRLRNSGGLQATLVKLSGGNPLTDPAAEIVIKLDWSTLAGVFPQFDTYAVAAAAVPPLLRTNFVTELNGRALAELPLHLIGHSRGGSLVCQMGRLLGTNGVWVDHLTTLDPHPVNEDGNMDPLFVTDAPLRVYDNVLFADNYFQIIGAYPNGQFMPSSYNRELTVFSGGYASEHSDTHLWYHATLDGSNPVSDSEATLQAGDRAAWFLPAEQLGSQTGYRYSRTGGGDRFSTNSPAGAGTDRLVDGYNQRWSLGAGLSANRTALPANAGTWPNVLRMNLAGASFMAQGESNAVALYHQWARPATSNATLGIHLDADLNPWNGNEWLVRQLPLFGTTSNQVGAGVFSLNLAATNSTPGQFWILASLSDGVRSRRLYASERLTLVSSLQPPALEIARLSSASVRVDVLGVPGQRLVLQRSTNLVHWQPLATNWLATNRWTWTDSTLAAPRRFYRASVE